MLSRRSRNAVDFYSQGKDLEVKPKDVVDGPTFRAFSYMSIVEKAPTPTMDFYDVEITMPYDESFYGTSLYRRARELVAEEEGSSSTAAPINVACSVCNQENAAFRCSRCKSAYYCSKGCLDTAFTQNPCC